MCLSLGAHDPQNKFIGVVSILLKKRQIWFLSNQNFNQITNITKFYCYLEITINPNFPPFHEYCLIMSCYILFEHAGLLSLWLLLIQTAIHP